MTREGLPKVQTSQGRILTKRAIMIRSLKHSSSKQNFSESTEKQSKLN